MEFGHILEINSVSQSQTHTGSSCTPSTPDLISYAPLSRMRTGGVVISCRCKVATAGMVVLDLRETGEVT